MFCIFWVSRFALLLFGVLVCVDDPPCDVKTKKKSIFPVMQLYNSNGNNVYSHACYFNNPTNMHKKIRGKKRRNTNNLGTFDSILYTKFRIL